MLFSVIIPTYRRPKELKNAIDSVIRQSHSEFEIIVVNDDVNDTSVSNLIDEFNDERINYLINNRTKGPCGARNTGMLAANGQFIAFLDDDDIWFPDRLNAVENCLVNEKTNGIISGYRIKYGLKYKDVSLKNYDNVLGNYLADNFSLGSGSNFIIKKEILEKIGLFDENLLRQEDTEFFVRYLSNFKVSIISPPLFQVNFHGIKPSPEITIKTRNQFLDKNRNIIDHLPRKYKSLFYSNHFRRLSLLFLKLNDIQSARQNMQEARKHKLISTRKDVKFLMIYLNNFKRLFFFHL